MSKRKRHTSEQIIRKLRGAVKNSLVEHFYSSIIMNLFEVIMKRHQKEFYSNSALGFEEKGSRLIVWD